MSMATMTIVGMYQFKDGLFNNLKLPDGINKEDVINQILLDGSNFEILYSDFKFMQDAIGLWSNTWYRTFEKWQKALSLEYNPIENYDRMEDWTDSSINKTNRNSVENRNLSNSMRSDRDLQIVTKNTGSDNNLHNVSPYDSGAYVADSQDIVNLNNQSATADTGSMSTNGTDSGTVTNTGNDSSNTDSTHKGRTHGNIGVTTSQQMLEAELKIARFNLVKQISDVFIKEFCIMLY